METLTEVLDAVYSKFTDNATISAHRESNEARGIDELILTTEIASEDHSLEVRVDIESIDPTFELISRDRIAERGDFTTVEQLVLDIENAFKTLSEW